MKIKFVAALLLLATLLGSTVSSAYTPQRENSVAPCADLITAHQSIGAANTAFPENLLNLAATDDGGEPLFRIVYNISASQRVVEQCNTLAADIYETTGVLLPVAHSMEKQNHIQCAPADCRRLRLQPGSPAASCCRKAGRTETECI